MVMPIAPEASPDRILPDSEMVAAPGSRNSSEICLYSPTRSDANTSCRWMAGQKPLYSASTPSSAAMRRIMPIMPMPPAAGGAPAAPAAPPVAALRSSCSRTLAVSMGSVATSAIDAPRPAQANVAHQGSSMVRAAAGGCGR